jgi:hypothetical protein
MKKRILILSTIIISIVIALAAFIFLKKNADAQKQSELLSQVRIVNNTRSLEVLNTVILYPRDPRSTLVEIEVRNISDKPIIAIRLESGNEKSASSLTAEGFNEGDVPPTIILRPGESMKIDFSFSSIHPGLPIRIGAVMFADGTGDGESGLLEQMHKSKERIRNRQA